MTPRLVVAIVLTGTALLSDCTLGRAQPNDRVETIKKMWDAQRQEIASAYIRCRAFGSGAVNGLTYQELRTLLDSVELAKNPDDFKKLVDAISSRTITAKPPWAVMEYYFQGSKVKENNHFSGRIQLFNGDVQADYDPDNQQTIIHKPGEPAPGIRRLDDFRLLPATNQQKLDSRAGNLITLREDTYDEGELAAVDEYIVEAGSAAVREVRMLDSTRKHVNIWIIQNHFVEYPGGIRFPSFAAYFVFDAKGRLNVARFTLIEEARFNEELPENAFHLPVPESTKVIDERGSRVSNFLTTKPTNDLVSVANSQPIASQPKTYTNWFDKRWKRMLLVLLGVAIMFFFGIWLRSRNRHRPKENSSAPSSLPN